LPAHLAARIRFAAMPFNHGPAPEKGYDPENHSAELIPPGIERKLKCATGAAEPAWNNGHVGIRPGVLVWRVENYALVAWPEEMTGQFFDGDSYVILHSRETGARSSRHLAHDIYFWLGAHTSVDEAGVAAYKTLELDEILNGVTVQHRELQAAPSDAFMQVFPRSEILHGGFRAGSDRGRRVVPGADQPQLLSMQRVFKMITAAETIFVVVVDVEPVLDSLNDEDVFVIDSGDKIWVWVGRQASAVEKARSAQIVYDMLLLKDAETETVAQNNDRSSIVLGILGASEILPPSTRFLAERPMATLSAAEDNDRPRRLLRLVPPPSNDDKDGENKDKKNNSSNSNSRGEIEFSLVKENAPMARDDLRSDGIFLVDTGCEIWIWEGMRAIKGERRLWLRAAQTYLQSIAPTDPYAWRAPLAKVCERRENNTAFLRALMT
jgi:gelsolin